MSRNSAFEAGFLSKVAAAGNPAAPAKSSLPSGGPEAQRFAPYLNTGDGGAPAHVAGPIANRPQPWPGYVNVKGGQSADEQKPGLINRHGSPDTGDLGPDMGGDQTVTKSASFMAGFVSAVGD